jgi:hypothetical protein
MDKYLLDYKNVRTIIDHFNRLVYIVILFNIALVVLVQIAFGSWIVTIVLILLSYILRKYTYNKSVEILNIINQRDEDDSER